MIHSLYIYYKVTSAEPLYS